MKLRDNDGVWKEKASVTRTRLKDGHVIFVICDKMWIYLPFNIGEQIIENLIRIGPKQIWGKRGRQGCLFAACSVHHYSFHLTLWHRTIVVYVWNESTNTLHTTYKTWPYIFGLLRIYIYLNTFYVKAKKEIFAILYSDFLYIYRYIIYRNVKHTYIVIEHMLMYCKYIQSMFRVVVLIKLKVTTNRMCLIM